MARHGLAPAALLAAALALSSCSSHHSTGTPGGKTPSGICTRDTAAITARPACVADDSCPCGAHCALGACQADCLVDSDCGHGTCDAFGTCRAAGDKAVIPPLHPVAEGDILLAPAQVPAAAVQAQNQILRVVPKLLAPGKVRVLADAGLEVRCDPSGTFASECTLTMSTATDAAQVEVRSAMAFADGDVRMVRVFAGTKVRSTSFQAPAPAAVANPVEGDYSGSAERIAGGVGDDPAVDLGATLTLPVTARLFGEPGSTPEVLEIDDAARVLDASGSWVGQIVQQGTGLQATFPARLMDSGNAFPGTAYEVVLVTDPGTVNLTDAPRALRFEVVVHEKGLGAAGRDPWTRWRVSLSRSAVVDGSAPSVPADYVATLSPSRAGTPLPWEAALRSAFPHVGLSALDLQQSLLVCPIQGGGSCTPDPKLNTCQLGPDEQAILTSRASLLEWPGSVTSVNGAGLQATSASGVFSCPANQRETTAQLAGSPDATLSALGRALPAGTLCGAAATYQPVTVNLPQGPSAGCAFDIESAALTGRIHPNGGVFDDYVLDASLPRLHQDFCGQLAAQTGCTPMDLPAPQSVPVLTWSYDSYLPSGLPAYYSTPIGQTVQASATVSRVCIVRTQGQCAELAACATPNTESTFATTPGRVSGDDACQSGVLGAAIPMDRNADLPESDLARLPAGQMLDACYTDLGQLATTTPPGSVTAYDLASIFHDGTCLDGPRFVAALGLATSADRARAGDPSVAVDPRSSAYAGRLLQRWTALHAWLARDAADEEQLADVIRAAPQPGVPPPRPIDDVIAASLDGWKLFTLPRIAEAIDQMPASVLYAPDYRSLVAGSPVAAQPSDEQPAGLPVAMLEAMQAQLQLAEIRLDKALFVADPTAMAPAAEVVRWVELMRPVALNLVARAMTAGSDHGGAPPDWLAREKQTDAAVVAQLARVVGAAQALHLGKNPFGIDDSELPLYFLGDATGSGGRFAAISDYLLGAPQNTSAWAPALVKQASDDLDAARQAWTAQQDRQLQVKLAATDQTQKVEAIASQSGDQILALCGDQPGISSSDALDHADLDASTCFIKTENPSCTPSNADWLAIVTPADIQAQFCQAHVLTSALGPGVGFSDPLLAKISDAIDDCTSVSLVTCPKGTGNGDGSCFKCTRGKGDLLAPVGYANLHGIKLPEGADSLVKSAKDTCTGKLPGARVTLPGLDELPFNPLDQGSCYRGSLGELALTVRSAAKDVDIARAQFDSLQQSYDIAMRSCIILQNGDAQIEEATKEHDDNMHKLRIAKAACDSAAAAAGAVKDCASAAKDDLTFGAASGTACAAAAVQAAAQIASIGLQAAMDDAQAEHDALVMKLQDSIDQQRCFNDAKQNLVGARTAALQIEKSMIDMEVAVKNFDEAKASLPGLYSDGRAALEVVKGRANIPASHDYWVNDKVSLYTRDMALARRTTYLAVRAVEWEFQQSLTDRAQVLAASQPSDLQAVLQDLWLTAGTRRIAGNAPTDLKVILSLRDNLLRLADHSKNPPTGLPLDPTERFRALLRSGTYSVYDDTGAYLGQRIPFTLAPLGKLGQDGMGIPVLAGSDCAERLWSVNASILGSSVYQGTHQTFTRLELQKSNSFYSQWCAAPGPDQPTVQLASVRPSHNLFRDPVLGASVGTQFGVDAGTEGTSTARIEAYFNVSDTDFEADTYANGDTSELAARGLYGDYWLFVPAEVLSRTPDGSTAPTDGLVLNQLDDILLRLDYVSVAR